MSIDRFLATVYGSDPWHDTAHFVTDDQNFFANAPAFEILIQGLSPQVIIEVGSWKGHSANAMADICKSVGLFTRIVCVDTWLGSREHWVKDSHREQLHFQNGRPTLYERFMGNVHSRGNSDVIWPLPLPSRTAASVLSKFGVKADLIYIDGAHGYQDVMDDLKSYFPLLSSRGMMFGDDFQYQPLVQAVREFAEANSKRVVVNGRRKWLLAERDDELPGFVPVADINEGQAPV